MLFFLINNHEFKKTQTILKRENLLYETKNFKNFYLNIPTMTKVEE
jgi:hypothetical protein